MQSKIAGIPFIAIMFVLLTSVFVAILVCAYLNIFFIRQQNEQLSRIETGVDVLQVSSQPTVIPTPTIVISPTAGVYRATVKESASTSAK